MTKSRPGWQRWLVLAATVCGLLLGYWLLTRSSAIELFGNVELLARRVVELGALGPVLLISLMALAILFNPLPSAPIALTAGALYGHALGAAYVVIGAEIGAIAAFLLARGSGFAFTRGLFEGDRLLLRLRSQNALTAVVFVSRLIPFVSFDLISYAAGLTPLRLWRFALATLFGLMPMSFLLAHIGSEITSDQAERAVTAVLAAGLLTLLPLLAVMWRGHRRRALARVERADASRREPPG